MNNWIPKFVKCLELGTTDASLITSLEEIILRTQISNRSKDKDYQPLIEKYGQEGLSQRFEEFLDRLLVSDNAVCEIFPITLPEEQAKKRYRQLIRIFHPDRGVHDQAWLNYRAERINKAYQSYENRPAMPTAKISKPTPAKSKNNNRKSKETRVNTAIKYRPNALREKFGDARSVQRKIVLGLLVFSLVLILIVFASSRDVGNREQTEVAKVQSQPISVQDSEKPQVVNLNADAQKLLDEAQWLNEESSEVIEVAPIDTELTGNKNEGGELNSDAARTVSEDKISGKNARIASEAKNAGNVAHNQIEETNVISLVESKVSVDHATVTSDTDKAQPDLPAVNAANAIIAHCKKIANQALPIATKEIYLVGANLNVRLGPSIECPAKGLLSNGLEVVKLRYLKTPTREWAYVRWRDVDKQANRYGWVSDRFLKEIVVKDLPTNVAGVRTQKPEKWVTGAAPSAKKASSVKLTKSLALDKATGSQSSAVSPEVISTKDRGNDLLKWQAVIKELDEAFELGNAVQLADLYITSGRENRIRGIDRILKLYTRQFSKTADRSVSYNVGSYEYRGDNQVVLKGRMVSAATQRSSGRKTTSVATFTMIMVKVGSSYKISSFDWKRI